MIVCNQFKSSTSSKFICHSLHSSLHQYLKLFCLSENLNQCFTFSLQTTGSKNQYKALPKIQTENWLRQCQRSTAALQPTLLHGENSVTQRKSPTASLRIRAQAGRCCSVSNLILVSPSRGGRRVQPQEPELPENRPYPELSCRSAAQTRSRELPKSTAPCPG